MDGQLVRSGLARRSAAVLTGVMLASLLMAAALPEAFGEQGAAVRGELRRAPGRPQRRRGVAPARAATGCATCSSGWSSGAPRPACCGWPARRSTATSGSLLWIPALALELAAPAAGYWLPGRGRAVDDRLRHRGSATSPSAASCSSSSRSASRSWSPERPRPTAGLTSTVVLCLVVAFVETAALWWLYFGATAEHARVTMSSLRRPRSPRARRLHLSAPADHRGHHRDRGRQRPADRRAARGARTGSAWRWSSAGPRSTCSARACSAGG